MKIWFWEHKAVLVREEGDPKFYGDTGESRLLYHAKRLLNECGFDLVKVRMWKDGHLVDDLQQYIRARKGSKGPHICIYSTFWAIHGANVPWNCGTVSLRMQQDIWGVGQDAIPLIKELCAQHKELEWKGQ